MSPILRADPQILWFTLKEIESPEICLDFATFPEHQFLNIFKEMQSCQERNRKGCYDGRKALYSVLFEERISSCNEMLLQVHK